MVKDPYKYFRIEVRELLEQLGQGALELDKGVAGESLVPRMLRQAHTLKGAARVVKQADIANQAHAIEEALAPWRDAAAAVPRPSIDAVLARLDEISACVAALSPAPDSQTPARPGALPEEALRTVRADVAEMDGLIDGVAQTHAQIAGLRRRFGGLASLRSLAQRLQEQLAPRPANGARTALALANELSAALADCAQGLALSLDQMDRELRQVRDAAEQLRLVPAGALFTMLERSARDAAQALGKQVIFDGRGADVRLDSPVLGAVQNALVQLVRNAVAHGIENAAQRLAAGKPPEGRITLEVLRRGRRVTFRCSDDGAGVDVDAVRRAAQRKGLLAAATRSLDAQALLGLLLRGGLSTSGTVTEMAGRGIGLDVVREVAERLGGEVAVNTHPGRGTALALTVPLSLASLDALVVEAGGSSAAIPFDAVRRTLRLQPAQIARGAQGDSIVFDERAIPYVPLTRVLDSADAGGEREQPVSAVVVEGAGALAAIGVERLGATAKIVLRPLPELAPPCPVVAGASLDVEGRPRLVLDPEGLVLHAQNAGAPAPPLERERVPVLVIDDSLTTRMLEQSILESAGYEVHAAVSAEDALAQARRRAYALFLVDVEMPGMDGFAFIEHTRADPALREVPAILVTSRASPEDKRRGRDVGAQGYIVKSEFAQAEFLDHVRQLVGASS
ncbi:MAG TPA: response regulator [Burkholderiaceae bacterium]|jgi:two-component system chemotaxis sensor kinase CheA|nr:response regulator [Burkholderiaceae bacterium]